MAQVIALTALAALGLSGAPFHEPFHADGRQWSMAVTERSDRNPPQRRRNLTTWSNTTGHPPARRAAELSGLARKFVGGRIQAVGSLR